jgi:hypothetical protein
MIQDEIFGEVKPIYDLEERTFQFAKRVRTSSIISKSE